MVRRDGAETRRQRIQEIGKFVLSLLHSKDGEIPLGKTVSTLMYQEGLTKDKIVEYLGILADLDRFVLDVERDKIRSVALEEPLDE